MYAVWWIVVFKPSQQPSSFLSTHFENMRKEERQRERERERERKTETNRERQKESERERE